jgi:hypothetical protein
MVSNQKLINFKGNDYIVKFPNVGQLMDIENIKMSLTNGKYVEMAISVLKIHIFQLDMIDAISYFSILCPEMKTNLGIKNWRDLDASLAKEITSVYKKQFIPWFKPILDDLLKIEEDDSAPETTTESE